MVLLLIVIFTSGCGTTAKEEKTTEKPALPKIVRSKTVSHKDKITKYDGPQTCAMCHQGVIEDVANSVHYKLKGPVTAIEGVSGEYGMSNRECGLPGSIANINWIGILNPEKKVAGGCARCHIGNGAMITDPVTDEQKQGIDCLICHAEKYDMSKRFPVEAPDKPEKFRIPQDRSLEAAQSVGGPPTKEACLRCHEKSGGGSWWKRGIDFSPERDIHSAAQMICTDCHKAEKHQFAHGTDPGGWATDNAKKEISCRGCHTDKPHTTVALNEHTSKIECEVCHIPTIGGVVTRDFVNVVKNQETGLFDPKPSSYDDKFSTKPTYFWYNGKGTNEIKPIGSKDDGKSKIAAFKPLKTVIPVDAQTGKVLFMQLGVLSKTGSVDAAIAKGIELTKQQYSGKWMEKTITGYFTVSHNVTLDKALTCADCHSKKDYLNLKMLGYTAEEVKKLTDEKNLDYKE